jgi:hypothetical protein
MDQKNLASSPISAGTAALSMKINAMDYSAKFNRFSTIMMPSCAIGQAKMASFLMQPAGS